MTPTATAIVAAQTINVGFNDPAVANVLFFNSQASFNTAFQLHPTTYAGALVERDVTVTQFGSPSPGYWVIVFCPLSNPTSFASNLALQLFTADSYINIINFWYIQDMETLHIGGLF